MSLAEFFAMGGYAFYVWGAYGVTAALLVLEIVAVRARFRAARRAVQAPGTDA
jgi:heme exporter protein D